MAKRHHGKHMSHSEYSKHHVADYAHESAMEHRDAGMIGNDHSRMANLPTEVMMKPYPPCPAYMDWNIEDNIKGIDKQIGEDNAKRKSGFQPHKY